MTSESTRSNLTQVETTQFGELTVASQATTSPPLPSLVVLWGREEPDLPGALATLPFEPTASYLVLGRPDASIPASERLRFIFQRPGAISPAPDLRSPRISRRQLRVQRLPDGLLRVSNQGSAPMLINGLERQESILYPNDVLEIRNELLLLCVMRPKSMPVPVLGMTVPSGRFGERDEVGIVGESPAIWKLRQDIAFWAPMDKTHLLIYGSSGSGKELVAQAVHKLSGRGHQNIVSRSAATITESLVDAELFGNLRDYPNRGQPERPGLIGEADRSTLYLDEIGELSEPSQVRLLRVLDEGEYQRLGESRMRKANVRAIGATNRPESYLKQDVRARFLGRIDVPDLNSRREDIPLLVRHLLKKILEANPMMGRHWKNLDPATGVPRVHPSLLTALVRHTYTTNARELSELLVLALKGCVGTYLELTPEIRQRYVPCASERPSLPQPLPTEMAVTLPQEKEPVAAAGDVPPPFREELKKEDPREMPPRVQEDPDAPVTSEVGFTPRELELLEFHRRYAFSPTACARDVQYAANRQKADLHIRQLCCRALELGRWDMTAAARLLAGPTPLDEVVKERLERFVVNLRRRLEEEGRVSLQSSLDREFKGHKAQIHRVLDWLEQKV